MKNATTIAAMTFATLLTTGLMAGNAAAAPQQCGASLSITGAVAHGALKRARVRRATRKAKRSWEGYVQGETGGTIFSTFSGTSHPSYGLGSRFADLDNAKNDNVVINCKGAGRGKTRCTVTATPCTK